MSVTKAIIPVAGWGARRLPITKSIEKCMLPIGNRPIVDYVVRDCILAGITDIYFVVSQGSTQLQQYYSENARLNEYLQYNGQTSMLELAHPPQNVQFHYIEQDPNDKYGTAVPVALAVPYLQKGESAAIMMGDDFVYNPDGSSELFRQIQATPQGGNSMLTTQVPREQVSKYGVIQFQEDTGAFEQLIEKPPVDQAPSNYINISKFILNYDLMLQIYNYCNLDVSGEFEILAPINQYVLAGGVLQVIPVQGHYLDGGNVHDWLRANEVVVNHEMQR
jgi:UTP--glucose-1-phosphate uridylyltransferase